MFKGLGTWLGLENPAQPKTQEDTEEQNVVQEVKEEAETEENKHPAAEVQRRTEAEQDKHDPGKGLKAAVPPWVGYNEEETIQQQILALSADKRNFLRDPPAGVQFHFDMEQMYPLAAVMLEEDELLNRMRFDLVPKHVKEEMFWRNYFYRVSLIKQSAQLTALAAQQQQQQQDSSDGDSVRARTPPVSISDLKKEDEGEISTSPGVSEFVSDAFDSAAFSHEDLRKGMEQLVLDKKDSVPTPDDFAADWEKELQQELQEYEVVTESDNKDDQWDQEIEKMLQADNS
uniref:Synapse-associated protein 1 n=1 Tax=Oryzias latipes TaxID=8090 RepID=A0A3P9L5D8_ORYLA